VPETTEQPRGFFPDIMHRALRSRLSSLSNAYLSFSVYPMVGTEDYTSCSLSFLLLPYLACARTADVILEEAGSPRALSGSPWTTHSDERPFALSLSFASAGSAASFFIPFPTPANHHV